MSPRSHRRWGALLASAILVGITVQLAFGIAVPSVRQDEAATALAASAMNDVIREAQTRQKLGLRLDELEFRQMPLVDALTAWSEHVGTSVFLVTRALDDANVDSRHPITLTIHNIRAGRALQILLDHAGEGGVPLAYHLEGGGVTVSTEVDLRKRNLTTSVFDVRDLTDPVEQTESELADHIRNSVAPDTWRHNGGTVGHIRFLRGQMIVTTTPEVMDDVAVLLARPGPLRGTGDAKSDDPLPRR